LPQEPQPRRRRFYNKEFEFGFTYPAGSSGSEPGTIATRFSEAKHETLLTEKGREIMNYKLELLAVPVTDVDRAKDFYVQAGFNADQDATVSDELRFVQLTPPGSACSICIGKGLTKAEPGSMDMILLVVDSAQAAYDDLTSRGIEATGIDEQPWGKFVYFNDPDGNKWSVQELPTRG